MNLTQNATLTTVVVKTSTRNTRCITKQIWGLTRGQSMQTNLHDRVGNLCHGCHGNCHADVNGYNPARCYFGAQKTAVGRNTGASLIAPTRYKEPGRSSRRHLYLHPSSCYKWGCLVTHLCHVIVHPWQRLPSTTTIQISGES